MSRTAVAEMSSAVNGITTMPPAGVRWLASGCCITRAAYSLACGRGIRPAPRPAAGARNEPDRRCRRECRWERSWSKYEAADVSQDRAQERGEARALRAIDHAVIVRHGERQHHARLELLAVPHRPHHRF